MINRMRQAIVALLLLCLSAGGQWCKHTTAAEYRVVEVVDVAPVWSAHPVGFALLTCPPRQYVAFYDATREMTVAVRSLDSKRWDFVRLPSRLGWDSHNYVTMAIDSRGHLHLSGNMHCDPLVYFRSEKPHDITTFEPVHRMVGRNESRCTYPRFFHGPGGQLLFVYRDGSSGNGQRFWNRYDPATGRWSRLMDRPLLSGQGKMNAYFHGPVQGPDGWYHLCWVWRDTPDCATNHHLCYARSKDLVHWQTSDGRELSLPITLDSAEIVDPVPPGGGMINGNTKIGFDLLGRVVISYHKFDRQGYTQLYNARREADHWCIYQASNWQYRWQFGGGGSIRFEIHFSAVRPTPDGRLVQSVSHRKYGSATWQLDPQSLRLVRKTTPTVTLPAQLRKCRSSWPEMEVRLAGDLGTSEQNGVKEPLHKCRVEPL